MRAFKIAFIVALFTLLALPLLCSFATARGADLGGVTKRGRSAPFALSSFVSGIYQQQAETHFARSLPVYGFLVRLDNQLSLWGFNVLSSNPKSRVVLGNGGHLIERSYLASFNRQSVPSRSRLVAIVKELKVLKDLLAQRGKAFVLLVSTNKPSFYPDVVPSWYRVDGAPEKQGGFEIFSALLRERGVDFIDARALLKAVEERDRVSIFPPTGTHWNDYAACHITAEIASRVAPQLVGGAPQLQCTLDGERLKQTDQDVDLLRLANVLFPESLIRPAPRFIAKVHPATSGSKPRLLMVGTSFCWQILQILNRRALFGYREFLYYFQRQVIVPGGSQRSIKKESFDVAAALDRSDVVVIEVNEAYVHRTGYGFIERAIDALSKE